MRSLPFLRSGAAFVAVVAWVQAAGAWDVRTAGDLPELSSSSPVVWQQTVRHEYVDDRRAPFDPREVEDAWNRAVGTWAEPECAELPLGTLEAAVALPASDDGVHTLSWIAFSEVERPGFEVERPAVTLVSYERLEEATRIVEADIYLNLDHSLWNTSENEPNHDALVGVLTHELGHVLGLLHPCEEGGESGAPDCGVDPENSASLDELDLDTLPTMWPGYHASATSLTLREALAICDLYPREEPPGGGTRSPEQGLGGANSAGDYGAPCETPAECEWGLCLMQDGEGVCSRPCDDACPDECVELSGRQVCAPPLPLRPERTGCSYGGALGHETSSPTPTWHTWGGLSVLGLSLLRLSRRRAQRGDV